MIESIKEATFELKFKGARVRMLHTYPGFEGNIVKEVKPNIYEIQTDNGIAIVTGPSSFTFVK